MTKVLALSGRKNSGKNTAANFLLGLTLQQIGITTAFKITDKGELWINDIEGDKSARGLLDVSAPSIDMRSFLSSRVDDYIKLYSFADILKQSVCMKILGLSYEQCYGTNDQKNSATNLCWENMPGVFCTSKDYPDQSDSNVEVFQAKILIHEPGIMSARDVLQYVGTNIFRQILGNVWADACLRNIKNDNSDFAIITDARFPNEVEAVQKAGGKVMRFTRNPYPDDNHASETILDPENYDWDKFDMVVDNANFNIGEQNKAVYEALYPIAWVPQLFEIVSDKEEMPKA